MTALTPAQSDRLLPPLTQLRQLLTEVDAAGAEEILEELYLLITEVYEQFPQLDQDEEG